MFLSKKSNKKNSGKRSMQKTRKGGKKSKMTSKKTGKKGTKKGKGGKGGKGGKKQFRKMSKKNQKKGGEGELLIDKVREKMKPYTEEYVYDMINEYHNSSTTEDRKDVLSNEFNNLKFHIDKNALGNDCFYDTQYLKITLKMVPHEKNAAFFDSPDCSGFRQINIEKVTVPYMKSAPNIGGKYTFFYTQN